VRIGFWSCEEGLTAVMNLKGSGGGFRSSFCSAEAMETKGVCAVRKICDRTGTEQVLVMIFQVQPYSPSHSCNFILFLLYIFFLGNFFTEDSEIFNSY